ncbi:HAD-like protein [Alternaria alternata]|jgi:hypothetical protein|nr:HAD-like protein [Alternaria alternata]
MCAYGTRIQGQKEIWSGCQSQIKCPGCSAAQECLSELLGVGGHVEARVVSGVGFRRAACAAPCLQFGLQAALEQGRLCQQCPQRGSPLP